ncbi:MAG: hypothetical protein LWY06_14735 [Firmicutes bacterium]|nr:hypothetical protein [Bacillota bacterium]
MKAKQLVIIIAALVISTLGKAFAEDWIIYPGSQVGWVTINKTTIKDVVKKFGNLDGRSKDGSTILYRNRFGLDFIYDPKTLKVISVMITKDGSGGIKYRTDTQLFVGAPMASVWKVYNKPAMMNKKAGYDIYTYFDKDRFLTFVGKGGNVVMIWTGMKSVYDAKFEEFKESLQ